MAAKRKAQRKASSSAASPEKAAACEDEAAAEAGHFERTLRANRQVASGPGPLPPGATHVEEKDEQGRTRVKRKRFSAV